MGPLLLVVLLLSIGTAWGEQKEIVVCHYNVENYVETKSPADGSRYGSRQKSEEAIAALVDIIKQINPDILGVCEMGSPARFEEFKTRLNEAGLGYTDSEYVEAA